jgi:hypothetical protein
MLLKYAAMEQHALHALQGLHTGVLSGAKIHLSNVI